MLYERRIKRKTYKFSYAVYIAHHTLHTAHCTLYIDKNTTGLNNRSHDYPDQSHQGN